MSRLKGIAARLRSVLRPGAAERRMEEEFAFHIDAEAARLEAAGRSRDEARRLALVAFGGVDPQREQMRDGRGTRWILDAIADLRYALRIMERSPGVAVAIALTLGVGIGVNGFTYSVVDGLLVRPVPARAPEELVAMFARDVRTGQTGNFAYDDYVDFRDGSGVFADAAGMMGVPLNVATGEAGAGSLALVWGEMVTENYFSVLDMTPAAGRFFDAADAPQGANAFVVLSYQFWQRRFGGDPAVVGRVIRVNGREFAITGVAPIGFRGMRTLGYWPDLWVPAGMHRTIQPGAGRVLEGRGRGWMVMFARMRPGWTLETTTAGAEAFAARLAERFPDANRDRTVVLLPARSGFENPQFVNPQVLTLSSALGLVASVLTLLVICANLANLQLARAASRRREIAIRLSLGCSRSRLVRQLLVETSVLALPGAALAAAIVSAAPLVEPFMVPRLPFQVGIDLTPNLRIALFTACVGGAAVALLGLVPAWAATRIRIAPAPPQLVGNARRSKVRLTLRGALVVCQIAVSVVLLAGAVLFTRSLYMALSSDVGFDTRNRLLLSTNVGLQGYDEARGRRFYEDVAARVRAMPDVVAAAWTFPAPFDTEDRGLLLYVDGAPAAPDGIVRTNVSVVSEDFVEALGLHLTGGRAFERRDSAASAPVIVVSQSLATRLWPREDPIGKVARIGGAAGPPVTVIGVVGDARFQSLGELSAARAYLPLRQRYRDWQTLIVQTRGDPRRTLPRVREIVGAADATLPIFGVTTLDEAVASGRSAPRTAAAASALFGGLALLVSAIGLYAVVASSVSERTREIGLRLALGSTPSRIMRQVMTSGARLGAWGLGLGLAGAVALARVMAGLLVGVPAFDPLTFTVVPAVLLIVVFLATYLPARRAVRLNPTTALRVD
jgi:predicted permease